MEAKQGDLVICTVSQITENPNVTYVGNVNLAGTAYVYYVNTDHLFKFPTVSPQYHTRGLWRPIVDDSTKAKIIGYQIVTNLWTMNNLSYDFNCKSGDLLMKSAVTWYDINAINLANYTSWEGATFTCMGILNDATITSPKLNQSTWHGYLQLRPILL